ncbi:hypothetical protein [Bradyrhizobium australafricanum]|uniref:hypothetical protein n=1 Tax=Bradyrhizobium australafricanum TaxID=2821406 RepID=UPI001CE39B58|nr:hypothetical protein [Bradyrhizobium australafricanum]MCA6104928.1 hypothetical protein [Bradyrhizobium australafricanum]
MSERGPDGGVTLRLTTYRSDAQLSVVADELMEGITDGWQSADECPVIDGSEEAE